MSATRDAEIARLYREVTTNTTEIGMKVGVSARSVCRALVRAKVRDLKAPPAEHVLTQRMLDFLEDGAPYVDVAETFNVPVKWLRDNAPGYGWDGQISGSIQHALRKPEARRIFKEIRSIPLEEAIRITAAMPVRNGK